MELMEHIAQRIRDLRQGANGGKGISQTALAQHLNVAANTISRWETNEYKPRIEDLDKLARFFGVSVLEFFDAQPSDRDERANALLRATQNLDDDDIAELQQFAEFIAAKKIYKTATKSKRGRKKKATSES